MLRLLRRAVRQLRSRPQLLLAGVPSAAATTIALLALFACLFTVADRTFPDALFALLIGLLVYDAVLAVTKPLALPGLYALLREDGTARSDDLLGPFWTATRQQYRAVLAASIPARVATLGFSLLLAPLVVGLALVGATGASVLLYAGGVVQTPAVDPYVYAAVALLLAVWVAGKGPVGFAELLTIDGEPPRTAWLASAGLLRRRPRTAGGATALRLLLGALPLLALGIAVRFAPSEGTAEIALPIGAFALAALWSKSLEAAVTVAGYEELVRSSPRADDRSERDAVPPGDGNRVPLRDRLRSLQLRPSQRTALAILLLTSLVVASGAVRVADVRPNAEPASPATVETDDPGELYAVARERTETTSRVHTVEHAAGNWSQPERDAVLRLRTALDYGGREAALDGWLARENGTLERSGAAYLSDGYMVNGGLNLDPEVVLDQRQVDGWRVAAAPAYATIVEDLPTGTIEPPASSWSVASRDDGTVVLQVDDPAAVGEVGEFADVSYAEYREGSRVRAEIDADTQRLRRVEIRERIVLYDGEAREEVDDRLDRLETVTYEYEDLGIERPDAVDARPVDLLWDLAYY